jgi:TonB family protein
MSDKLIVGGFVGLMIVLLGVGGYIIRTVLSDESPRKKSSVATVTMLKPPPITVKEKPPEPEPAKEIRRKEEIKDQEKGETIDSGPTKEVQHMDNVPARDTPGLVNPPAGEVSDNTPAGDRLGLDAEGKAGSDAFGLVARKGGRSILAGGGSGTAGGSESGRIGGSGSGRIGGTGSGKLSLLNKFGWYTQIVKTEISKKVQKQLDEKAGFPRGKLQTVVRISVNSTGTVVQSQIIDSSGNHEMDEAVKQSIGDIRISEPPPEGMPRTMIIRVTSHS